MEFCKHKSYQLHTCKGTNNQAAYWVKCDECGKIFDLHEPDVNCKIYTERKTFEDVRRDLGLCSKE